MREERITLTPNDQQRAVVLTQVVSGAWTMAEAAEALGLSERQVRRPARAYHTTGPGALVHGNRGRQPVHATAAATRERVVALAREKYAGFNDQHLTEKRAEQEQVVLGRETVRRILRAAGLPRPRKRRAPTPSTGAGASGCRRPGCSSRPMAAVTRGWGQRGPT